jgi:hypothetical protein
MPLPVRETLARIGDADIQLLQLGRTPIPGVIRKIGDFLSKNKFSETVMELGVSYFIRKQRHVWTYYLFPFFSTMNFGTTIF